MNEYMLNNDVKITKDEALSLNLSEDCLDFVNKLLEKKPAYRLGSKFPGEAKLHPWFSGLDWEGLLNKKVISPYYKHCLENKIDYQLYHEKYNKKTVTNVDDENLNLAYFKNNFNLFGGIYDIDFDDIKRECKKQNNDIIISKIDSKYGNNSISKVSKEEEKEDDLEENDLFKREENSSSNSEYLSYKNQVLIEKYYELIQIQLKSLFQNFYYNKYQDIYCIQRKLYKNDTIKDEKEQKTISQCTSNIHNKTTYFKTTNSIIGNRQSNTNIFNPLKFNINTQQGNLSNFNHSLNPNVSYLYSRVENIKDNNNQDKR